jgi:Domain of unknown function (DUF4382)
MRLEGPIRRQSNAQYGFPAMFTRTGFQNAICLTLVFAAAGVAGCGSTCFSGVINNGNGSLTIKSADPAPSCPVPMTAVALSASVVKTPVCQNCTSDIRIEHAYVTLRGVQLHADAAGNEGGDWIEIAPQLANAPRQIDLVGDGLAEMAEILVENADVPPGSYREVRLEFMLDELPKKENLSGTSVFPGLRNCVVMGDGRIEPLRLQHETPELVISIEKAHGHFAAILPGSRAELRLSLGTRRMLYGSRNGGIKLEHVLVEQAAVIES